MLVRQHRQAGFSNQQALLVLSLFSVGLIFLGLVVLVLKPVPRAAAPSWHRPHPRALNLHRSLSKSLVEINLASLFLGLRSEPFRD